MGSAEERAGPGVEALRRLTAEEAGLVAEWPLPAGVPDAIVNQYQLADALNVSQTTLANWRRAGLPIEVEGKNGRSYEFRLSICFAWMKNRDAADSAGRRAAEDAAQQLRLALIGGEGATGERKALSPREQKETLELEVVWMQAARRRGELMDAGEVIQALQAIFGDFRDGLDALPDRLGRDLGLGGAAIEAAQVVCDDILEGARRRIAADFGLDTGAADANPLGQRDLDL
jgi:phage terminase Nu1 subunit (DNA packaging protein)